MTRDEIKAYNAALEDLSVAFGPAPDVTYYATSEIQGTLKDYRKPLPEPDWKEIAGDLADEFSEYLAGCTLVDRESVVSPALTKYREACDE